MDYTERDKSFYESIEERRREIDLSDMSEEQKKNMYNLLDETIKGYKFLRAEVDKQEELFLQFPDAKPEGLKKIDNTASLLGQLECINSQNCKNIRIFKFLNSIKSPWKN